MKKRTDHADLKLRDPLPGSQWAAMILLAALIFGVLLIRYYRKAHFSSEPSSLPVTFDVQGAVKHPGIYLVENGPITVERAIEAAGGLRYGAPAGIPRSLALKEVSTGQLLRVESLPGGAVHIKIGLMEAKARLIVGEKLDPNRATADELCLLPRMKPEFAKAIVARRRTRPWRSVEELQEISGVGPKTVAKWKDYLQIGAKD